MGKIILYPTHDEIYGGLPLGISPLRLAKVEEAKAKAEKPAKVFSIPILNFWALAIIGRPGREALLNLNSKTNP